MFPSVVLDPGRSGALRAGPSGKGSLQPGARVCVLPFRERREYVPVDSLSNVLFSRVPEGTTIAPRLGYGAPDTGSREVSGILPAGYTGLSRAGPAPTNAGFPVRGNEGPAQRGLSRSSWKEVLTISSEVFGSIWYITWDASPNAGTLRFGRVTMASHNQSTARSSLIAGT